ncbi:glycosyltransferase family 2 protein [Larkinella harenae]
MKPLISLITINYNQTQMTLDFLRSSGTLAYDNYEIIVVDNASREDPTEAIDRLRLRHVRVVRSTTNLGFAGGNNLGMAHARGDYFFIVNNDTEMSPDLLNQLLVPFTLNSAIAVTSPKIKYFHQRDLIQYAGYTPMNMWTMKGHPIGSGHKDDGQFDQPGYTNFAHGCAMMVSRRAVHKVGGFARTFFLYYEELDWSQRIKNAHFLIYYQSTAVIYHKESASVGRDNPLKVYYMTRNRLLYIRRHGTWMQQLVFSLYFLHCVVPKHTASYLRQGRFKHWYAFLRGIGANLVISSRSDVS